MGRVCLHYFIFYIQLPFDGEDRPGILKSIVRAQWPEVYVDCDLKHFVQAVNDPLFYYLY
jgi:hypothetical protein